MPPAHKKSIHVAQKLTDVLPIRPISSPENNLKCTWGRPTRNKNIITSVYTAQCHATLCVFITSTCKQTHRIESISHCNAWITLPLCKSSDVLTFRGLSFKFSRLCSQMVKAPVLCSGAELRKRCQKILWRTEPKEQNTPSANPNENCTYIVPIAKYASSCEKEAEDICPSWHREQETTQSQQGLATILLSWGKSHPVEDVALTLCWMIVTSLSFSTSKQYTPVKTARTRQPSTQIIQLHPHSSFFSRHHQKDWFEKDIGIRNDCNHTKIIPPVVAPSARNLLDAATHVNRIRPDAPSACRTQAIGGLRTSRSCTIFLVDMQENLLSWVMPSFRQQILNIRPSWFMFVVQNKCKHRKGELMH